MEEVQHAKAIWSESDVHLESLSYTLRQQGFLLKQTARPKTELEYFQLFFLLITPWMRMSAMIPDAAEKIQKAKPLPTFSM